MNFPAKKILLAAFAFGVTTLAVTAQTAMSVGNLPLYFEANHGQADGAAKFIARGRAAQFQISPTEAQFVLQKSGAARAVQMRFIGANPQAQISGDSELAGKINYLTGNDPAQWRSGIPTFAKVRVADIYPGISVIYYGNQNQLEYDFTVAPNTNPNAIAIHFDGAEKISINAQGELVLNLGNDEIRQPKPLIYQNGDGARKEIDGGYRIVDAHTITFAVGNYDRSLPLTIDPILSYSTYFGGNFGETAWAVKVDTNSGDIFIAGQTFSTRYTNTVPFSFSTPDAYQTNFAGGTQAGDVFVARFDNAGTNLIYLTYLGGSGDDAAYCLAIDGAGDALVAGATDSTNFPINATNAIPGHTKLQGVASKLGNYPTDAFVSELDPTGSNLLYSTYLGGESAEAAYGIALDSATNIYLTGLTYSTNFPTSTNAYQNHLQCTNSVNFNANAFVTEIFAGNTNYYSTYFGGTNYDKGRAIAVDSLNNVYITGFTASTNFPALHYITQSFTNSFGTNSYHGNWLNGSTNLLNPGYDAFVAKFAPANNGLTLVYSTYLGGTNDDRGYGIAVDNSGAVYVTGSTDSTNFPQSLTNVIRSGLTNNTSLGFIFTTNAFLTKITNDAVSGQAGIEYSLTFGGTWLDTGYGLAIDPATNVFIVGTTSSTNFPCMNNLGSLRATNSGGNDVFVTAFNAANPTNCSLLYSAYLGGNSDDFGYGIAVDSAGSAYVVGQTLSTNFPTFAAHQTYRNGTNDTFLAKILLTATSPVLTVFPSGTNVIVAWPPVATEENVFKLQSNTNLLLNNWMTVPQSPVLTNGSNILTFNPTNPARFFRLRAN